MNPCDIYQLWRRIAVVRRAEGDIEGARRAARNARAYVARAGDPRLARRSRRGEWRWRIQPHSWAWAGPSDSTQLDGVA